MILYISICNYVTLVRNAQGVRSSSIHSNYFTHTYTHTNDTKTVLYDLNRCIQFLKKSQNFDSKINTLPYMQS